MQTNISKWLPTPSVPPFLSSPVPCPPYASVPVLRTRATWDAPLKPNEIACSAYNNSFTYPCCKWFGGESKTWCGRVQCRLTDHVIDEWAKCVSDLAGEGGHGEPVGLACTEHSQRSSTSNEVGGLSWAAWVLVIMALANAVG